MKEVLLPGLQWPSDSSAVLVQVTASSGCFIEDLPLDVDSQRGFERSEAAPLIEADCTGVRGVGRHRNWTAPFSLAQDRKCSTSCEPTCCPRQAAMTCMLIRCALGPVHIAEAA